MDADGRLTEPVADFLGEYVKDADRAIIAKLKGEGRIVNVATEHHSYPFCWRSDTPLIYKVPGAAFAARTLQTHVILQCSRTVYTASASYGHRKGSSGCQEVACHEGTHPQCLQHLGISSALCNERALGLACKLRLLMSATCVLTFPQATPSWFVRVTAIKDRLLANNKMTEWVPPDVRDRRFHNWLEARTYHRESLVPQDIYTPHHMPGG